MMISVIDKAFNDLIGQSGVHNTLRVTAGHIHTMRYNLKKGIHISLEKKLRLLQRTGWRQPDTRYTQADLVDLLKFYSRCTTDTRKLGPQYIVEKWKQASSK